MTLATPPPPSRPTELKVKSDSITIGWNESQCDGGHKLDSFTIQYLDADDPFFSSIVYIRNIDPSRRNYTITDLDPSTSYRIGIQAVSVERRGGAYSPFANFVTLPPGMVQPENPIHNVVEPLDLTVSNPWFNSSYW